MMGFVYVDCDSALTCTMKLWKSLKKRLNIQRQGGRDPTQLPSSSSEDAAATADAAAAAAAPGAANAG